MVDINLKDAQYDPKKLYDEARKAGMDIGDLEEYGLDDQMQFKDQSITNMVFNFVKMNTMLSTVVLRKVKDDWVKA